MKTHLATAAVLAALIAPSFAQPPNGVWDHNGSAMQLRYVNGNGFGVYYDAIRPGLIQTIPPGAPRFEGRDIGGGRIVGTAYVYTKYCFGIPFPYHVEGVAYNGTIELFGPAAVVDPYSCTIVGYRPDSDNAHIVFRAVRPEVVVIPAPIPVPVPNGDLSPDEQAEELQRQGREFCRKYPSHPVCNRKSSR
jgi:hypothetical protein